MEEQNPCPVGVHSLYTSLYGPSFQSDTHPKVTHGSHTGAHLPWTSGRSQDRRHPGGVDRTRELLYINTLYFCTTKRFSRDYSSVTRHFRIDRGDTRGRFGLSGLLLILICIVKHRTSTRNSRVNTEP